MARSLPYFQRPCKISLVAADYADAPFAVLEVL